MSLTVRDVIQALEQWAPSGSKLDFDRVGLQVGDARKPVDTVLVALDMTPGVMDEAESIGADLIITHHPLLFKPIDRLVPERYVSGLAYRLAASGIAYYASHTNLDMAPGGVSFALAEHLGIENLRFLDGHRKALVKLVTFVPLDHLEPVRIALAEAGAGRIGDYDACAFATPGTGFFRPGEAANPFIGERGSLESAEEVRLEAEVARWDLGRVLGALQEAHPYEEVAYDVIPLEQPHSRTGLGAIGDLPEPQPLAGFLPRISERLGVTALRFVGDAEAVIRRVAVCGGAGSPLIGVALRAGADAFITADITYHTFFEPLRADGTARMALIDPGHYESERITERLLVDRLQQAFPDLDVRRTAGITSPVRTFVSSAS
jgi:dinuclear metal center YbgI/SA1388 family protein